MNQYVSQGVFDRRVKLIEEKLKHISDTNLLNRLQAEHDYFIEQLRNTELNLEELIEQIEQSGGDTSQKLNDFVDSYNKFASDTLRFNDVFDSDGQFTGSIRPLSVETAALSVGTRSQQLTLNGIEFRVLPYTANSSCYLDVVSSTHSKYHFISDTQLKYYNDTAINKGDAGELFHYGFGTDTNPKVYIIKECRKEITWDNNNYGYYIYARLPYNIKQYQEKTISDSSDFETYFYDLYVFIDNNYVKLVSKDYSSSQVYYTKTNWKFTLLGTIDEKTYVNNIDNLYTSDSDESKVVVPTYNSGTTYYEKFYDIEIPYDIETPEFNIANIIISQNQYTFKNDSSQEEPYYSNGTHYLIIKIGYIGKGMVTARGAYERKVDMTYGQTTIDGRLITTGKIEGNGVSMDLDTGEIIGNLKFESGGESVQEIFERFQSELNGEIESWFKAYAPVDLSSQSPKEPLIWIDDTVTPPIPCLPYKDWYDTDNGGTGQEVATERIKHIGDLFYDTTTGKSFRFIDNGTENNHQFEWIQIVDSDIATALAQANSAMAKANAITYGTTSIAGGMITSNLMLLKKFGFINCDINSVFDSEKSYFTITNTGTSSEYHEVALNLDENTFNANKTSYYYINSTDSIVNSGVSGIEDFPAFWANGTESKAAAVRYWSNHYNTSPNTYTSAYEALKANASSLPTVFIDFNGTSRFGDMWIVGDAVKWTPSVNELKLYNNDDRTDWVTLRYNNGALQVVRQDGGDVYIQCTNSSTYSSNIQYYTKNGSTYTAASPNESIFNSNKTNYFYKDSTAIAGVYSDWISALGANSSGGGGGGGINWADFWNELNLSETHSYSGTKIIDKDYLPINGVSSSNGTFYAPVSSGTSGMFLKSSGTNNAPVWSNLAASDIPNLSASKITSGTLPIAQGGTGNTTGTAEYSRVLKNYYTYNTRPTSADFTHVSDGGIVHFKATSSMSTNYPGVDGHILHFNWDNSAAWDAQLFIPDSHSTSMKWRAQNSGPTWSTTWKTLIDSGNYNSYSPTLTGTGASGTWGISISGNAATSDYAKYQHTNEINFKNVPSNLNGNIWFNYRNGDTDAVDTSDNEVTYKFGNYNAKTSKTTLDATSFTGNAATASTLKYNSTIIYGAQGLQMYCTTDSENYGTPVDGTTITNPTDTYYYHLMLNYWNTSGYYLDIAAGLFSKGGNIYYRKVSGGTVYDWVKFLDSENYSSYALPRYNSNLIAGYIPRLSTTGQTDLANSIIFENSNGIGIGTASPAYTLDVSGKIRTTNTIIAHKYNSANNLPAITLDKPGSYAIGIGADGTSNRIKFGPCVTLAGDAWVEQNTFNSNQWFFQGYIHATNGIDSESYVTALATNSSDKRLKKEIKPFNAKKIIDKLSPVEFEWNKKANKYNSNLELNKKNYGLIAQDSDGIIDNLVFDLPDGKGYKGVRYEKLIPILLQAVKEQQKEIDELKSIVKQLKNK